jgi:hypothetical protein
MRGKLIRQFFTLLIFGFLVFLLSGPNGCDKQIIKTMYLYDTLKSGVQEDLNGIIFIKQYKSIAVGNNGTIIRSTNGGDSWASLTSTTTNNLYGVGGDTTNLIIAVGENGKILRSADGATTGTQ